MVDLLKLLVFCVLTVSSASTLQEQIRPPGPSQNL